MLNLDNTTPGYHSNALTFIRVSRRNPCRVCGKPDNCNVIEETGELYCRRIPSDRQGRDGGWFHPNPDDPGRAYDWRDVAPPVVALPKREPAAAEVRDRVYRRMFSACPLADADRSSIRGRGLSDEAIDRHMFGTLTADRADRDRLAALMLEGEDPGIIGHIPGIHRKDGRLTLAGAAGTMIAVVDENGLIVGVRIRKPGRGDNRYQWLSTPDPLDGCGSGAPLLVAIPAGCDDFSIVGVVEGEFKAIIAAERTGRPWVSIPGVTITAEVLPLLKRLGVREVWLAIDNDKRTNPQVAQAEAKLIEAVIAGDYAAHRLSWPERLKGLDDALAADIIPVAVVVSTVENGNDLARLQRLIDEERQYTAAAFAAINSRKNGPEARTAVAVVNDLKQRRIPVDQWTPYTNDRFTTVTGTSARRAADHKKLITQHYGDALEFRVTPKGDGKDLTYVRLNAPPGEALTAIAGHDPEVAKNGNGGHRTKQPACPTCGPDAGVSIVSQFQCDGCRAIIGTTPARTYRKRATPMLDRVSTIPVSSPEAPLTTNVKTVDRVSSIHQPDTRAPSSFPTSSPRLRALEAKFIHGIPMEPSPPRVAPPEPASVADWFQPETRPLDPWSADVLYGGKA